VRERDDVGYREALQTLGLEDHQEARPSRNGRERPAQQTKPSPAVPRGAALPTWDTSAALAVVEALERDLWAEVGEKARGWLAGRGILQETARVWRLGYNLRKRSIAGLIVPRGVVIPCFIGDAVWYVKVRRAVPEGPAYDPKKHGPKYKAIKGSKVAGLLFGLDRLSGKKTVVICEGEFDAILLHQEAGDLVDVVAIGSKPNKPAFPFLFPLVGATRWLVALDTDADKEANWWGEYSARVRRVRPLQGKDLTDFHQAGGDLRAWVTYHLERLDAPGAPPGGQAKASTGEAARTSPSGQQGKPADLQARMEALLAELEAATGGPDDVAEELLGRWATLEAELVG
jgi:hypothetical protein